jgi:hypothetical protein
MVPFMRRIALRMSTQHLAETPLTDPVFARIIQRSLGGMMTGPEKLVPLLELRYERHCYTHPVSAGFFCLDSPILCARTHPASGLEAHGLPLAHAVFEQRLAAHQPLPFMQALPRFGARRSSVSKYALTFRQFQSRPEIA